MSIQRGAVVAGHICLDILPGLERIPAGTTEALFRPGRLVEVGAATLSTGGAVSNTGLALHKLGIPTRLMGKTGEDLFGQAIRQVIDAHAPGLSAGLETDPGEASSYTVIISPPGVDRFFLHCPGANSTFGAEDVDYEAVAQAALFHFGYPPTMRRTYLEGGAELAEMFRRAKSTGATTSLDTTLPDPNAESGRVDWTAILRRALPYVDIFLPSIEELLFMLRRERWAAMQVQAGWGEILPLVDAELVAGLGQELIEMGARIVLIKLGDRGAYLRTGEEAALREMGGAAPADLREWAGRELWAPCFRVKLVGTTGSGDATIAGFLAALLRGLDPPEALTAAVAVGACNVEAADSLSGLLPWEDVQRRIRAGWKRLPALLPRAGGWREQAPGLWAGPQDQHE